MFESNQCEDTICRMADCFILKRCDTLWSVKDSRMAGSTPRDEREAEARLRARTLEVASEWLQQCVRMRLSEAGISANQLSAATGERASTWRNKLNGARSIRLDDLLVINMALDADLFAALPFGSHDLREFFPDEYRARLSHRDVGRSLPTFSPVTVDWWAIATEMDGWLRAERAANRGWLLTVDTVARHLLATADSFSLASMGATLAARTDTRLDLEWISEDLRLSVAVPMLPDEPIATPDARAALSAFGRDLIGLADVQCTTKVLVRILPAAVATTIGEVFSEQVVRPRAWFTIGIDSMHKLGLSIRTGAIPLDLQAQSLALNPDSGLVCLQLK